MEAKKRKEKVLVKLDLSEIEDNIKPEFIREIEIRYSLGDYWEFETVPFKILSRKEEIEEIINSKEFQNFCDFHCPFKSEGCRHRCSIFAFRIWLNGRDVSE